MSPQTDPVSRDGDPVEIMKATNASQWLRPRDRGSGRRQRTAAGTAPGSGLRQRTAAADRGGMAPGSG